MPYFLFGLAALVVGLLLVQAYTRANPAALARQLRIAGGMVLLAIAAGLLVRGAASQAIFLALLGLWLIWGRSLGALTGGQRSQPTPGQTSRVVTTHLDLELDHDTGRMTGRVLAGLFAGRSIESLKPTDLALLWQDCRHSDRQSAQIIETYLDAAHPSWREDMARGEREMRSGAGGRMSVEEALEILGLHSGASPEDIRRAHRELMLKLHPDRGGSTYLAAKINEAKDVLLGD